MFLLGLWASVGRDQSGEAGLRRTSLRMIFKLHCNFSSNGSKNEAGEMKDEGLNPEEQYKNRRICPPAAGRTASCESLLSGCVPHPKTGFSSLLGLLAKIKCRNWFLLKRNTLRSIVFRWSFYLTTGP
jgi:hypothetical protein